MYTTNKSTKSIADAALKVMMGEAKSSAQQAAIAIAMKEKGQKPKEEMKEALHPNQQKLDVHEPEKDELTKKDFEMLRKGKKAKVAEGTVAGDILKKIDEMKSGKYAWPGTPEYKKKFPDPELKTGEEKATKTGVVKKTIKGLVHTQKPMKEEVEVKKEEEVKVLAKEEVSFQNLINLYMDNGVESLLKTVEKIKEEASNDEFHKEVDENKKKAEGKIKQPEVAKGAVKAVAVTKEEVEQLAEKHYGSKEKGKKIAESIIDKLGDKIEELTNEQLEMIFEQIDAQLNERSMTEPEMKKREDIVKGMKKGLAGFKERYGKDAKSVMYATATKQAMKD
jgi:hypothetical protein